MECAVECRNGIRTTMRCNGMLMNNSDIGKQIARCGVCAVLVCVVCTIEIRARADNFLKKKYCKIIPKRFLSLIKYTEKTL